MEKAVFYHAGCPVCLSAEQRIAQSLDPTRFEVELVHLAEEPGRIVAAEAAGVRSVPALVVGGEALHINFGASLEALKK